MKTMRSFLLASVCAVTASSAIAQTRAANPAPADAAARAEATVKRMRSDEKTVLTHGMMPLPLGPNAPPLPAGAIPGAGYVAGIPRLGVPSLRETDASLGVSYVMGLRKDGATALPSGLAMAATWNDALIEQGGRMIGAEAKAKGFNVLLAGGVNLMRDPRNGRNFEYLGEDPLLAGRLVGHAIRGIQSNGILSTIKHFALNGQETGRKFVDSKISDAAARESDLLAFRIGMEIGNPGAVMCGYNRVNGEQACASDWLLNTVLKRDWGYRGFVMSDWGAVPGLDAALKGLDQQSGAQLDPALFFGDRLGAAAKADAGYAKRLDDMNRRVLYSIYQHRLDQVPARPQAPIDIAANASIAEMVARQGIVLLRNERGALPLAATAKRIAVIGGFADTGVVSGGGSSQVQGQGGAAVAIPIGGTGPFAAILTQSYHRSVPLDALKALAPQTSFRFRDGRYLTDAVAAARQADVAIVFATQWSTEGLDQPDMSLPNGQDALIEAVAAANPNTIVVLETGGPVLMPWLHRTAAVIEAWYPGARGGEAIASVLYGSTNPSGRLPVTFPARDDQLPRKAIDGADVLEPDFIGNPPHGDMTLTADYDIEGSDVGYRWNARKGIKAAFPFGFGLSYTRFATSAPVIAGNVATMTVTNRGPRSGATVAQLYLVSRAGKPMRRLVGYRRVELAAGASATVAIPIDLRLLADWQDGGWSMPAATYEMASGDSAEAVGATVALRLPERRWHDQSL
ncbi:glycosyl hydrolase [Sphingomonas glacialis]|uniref:Glycosyl hydrolase n=2 Tax=Sphingomonas glacialis TaxID=658225 RepID=A0A502FQP8_9SPHN|nr:glycoside hydrolase family 3 C-terminal domain-containing protein [Sphingomonas glacialis]TPG51744.1 glycosyl hydrolase [Sphingomonas glacialis]